jgi:hypothetical protein
MTNNSLTRDVQGESGITKCAALVQAEEPQFEIFSPTERANCGCLPHDAIHLIPRSRAGCPSPLPYRTLRYGSGSDYLALAITLFIPTLVPQDQLSIAIWSSDYWSFVTKIRTKL